MPKIRKIPPIFFFIKLEKLLFGTIFDHSGLKTPELNFFPKKLATSLFQLDDTLMSCKKSENFNEQFWRKTLDKQTNRPMARGYFIGPSFCGFKRYCTLVNQFECRYFYILAIKVTYQQ